MSEITHWQALPSEILQLITELGGWDATLARTLSQVCRSWRACILLNEYSLSNLIFSKLVSKSDRFPLERVDYFSVFFDRVLLAQNITANIVAARFCASHSDYDKACKYWRIPAKRGHPEAQANLGYAYYKARGVERDPEEAFLWLSRSCKTLLHLSKASHDSLPVLMTRKDCEKTLQYSAHILGILVLDGEALSALERDSSTAIKWLQVAHHHGCPDAGKLLQSMFRSGQY